MLSLIVIILKNLKFFYLNNRELFIYKIINKTSVLKLFNNFKSFFFGFSILISISSCSNGVDNNYFSGSEINENFQQKYGKQIIDINSERGIDKNQTNDKLYLTDQKNLVTPEDQFTGGDNISNSFDYVDKSYFGSPTPKQIFPNYETYQQGSFANPNQTLSPKIFEISYNTFLNPPFNNLGEEFDYIEIPDVDAFGVNSSSSNKNYTLIPINSLEKSINQINNSRTAEDIEFSKKIIAERKFLIRNKRLIKFQAKNQFVRFYDSNPKIIDEKPKALTKEIAMKSNLKTEKSNN